MSKQFLMFLIAAVTIGAYSEYSFGRTMIVLEVSSQAHCITPDNPAGIVPAEIMLKPDTEYFVRLSGRVFLNDAENLSSEQADGLFVSYNGADGEESFLNIKNNEAVTIKTSENSSKLQAWLYSNGITTHNTGRYELMFTEK